ncbi:MAG: hypothetical protein JOZ32_14290 [Bryobacterales bacterium]|nr:hypothetical protein [Bryobacterales bacterium]
MEILQATRVKFWCAALMVVGIIGAARPALAHHSFTMFDMTKRVTLNGTITSFEWTNPHSYIEIDVPDEKGVMKHWSIELGSPSILMQSGWKFNSLKPGEKITLIINPMKSGQAGGFLATATLPDGRVLKNGPQRGDQ